MRTKAAKKPKTVATYESLLRSVVLSALGDRPLATITPLDVELWLASLEARTLSASRRRQALQLLGQLLRAAMRNGLIDADSTADVGKPRLPRTRPSALTAAEVDRLAGQVPLRYRALVYVLAYGGLRWAEAAALRRRSVDLDAGMLMVTETLSEVGGRLYWVPPKTHQDRAVFVPGFVGGLLRDHLADLDAAPDTLVFTSPRGAPLRYGNFSRRVWAPALRAAGLPQTGTHVGRRTAASLLLAAGASVVDVQHHLGHEDATTTLNNYVAVSDDARRRLADRLDEAWRHIGADPTGGE
jgi:integrase